MLIFPAIDLMDGAAVRLEQGRRESVTVYDRAPWEVAVRFAAGSEHMVERLWDEVVGRETAAALPLRGS